MPTTPEDARRRLRAEIVTRLQVLTTESRHVAQAFSQTQNLAHTDLDALLFVMHEEAAGTPATPGRIADALGLTSGAVTGVIDRLVRAGHVERRRDEHDRRIVRVHYSEHAQRVARGFFAPLGRLTDDVMAGYTADELDVVTRFLGDMGVAMGEQARTASEPDPAAPLS
ncbi:MarR family transcriptional regulator [Frondihabitans sucicola]|uniref:MarR family transcriptional regulator n=1 Tax=Frondihabitans sucicola TaxID=1268041 RepID=A0ABM8GTP6_9MICO|nr:MarR family transcriptional regulator [Frondihabitans sucicola]BDZ51825.1 MarR family transcriptional regulator [Frondihabitans sucicola]